MRYITAYGSPRNSAGTETKNERYRLQVAAIADAAEFELCAECGKDLDAHILAPDSLGNAHAWCIPKGSAPYWVAVASRS